MKNNEQHVATEIVIFGALGDLSRRKLLPALYQLDLAGLLHEDSHVVAAARNDVTSDEFVELVRESLTTFVKEGLDESVLERFVARLVYHKMDFKDVTSFEGLATTLDKGSDTRVFYFSTSLRFNPCWNLSREGIKSDLLSSQYPLCFI